MGKLLRDPLCTWKGTFGDLEGEWIQVLEFIGNLQDRVSLMVLSGKQKDLVDLVY